MTEPVVERLEKHPFQLRAIYLRESQAKLDDDFDPLKPGQRLNGQFKSSAEHYTVTYEKVTDDASPIPRACTFSTKFEFVIRLGEESDQTPRPDLASLKVAASITACIAVDYLLAPGAAEPSAEYLERYGKSEALMHTWPYWREFCHSTMMRMHLPVMMVPLLVALPPPEPEAKKKVGSRAKAKQ